MTGRATKTYWAVGLGAACVVLLAAAASWYWVTRPLRIAEGKFAEGRWSLAARIALRYLERHPRSIRARRLVARSYFQLGRWDEAEQQFAQLAECSLEDRQLSALALLRANRLQEAAAVYEQLCAERPDDPNLLQQWAASLISLNKFDQAIQLGERLAAFPGHERAADFLLATAYDQKLEYATAVKYFERLLDDDPELSDPRMQRRVFWEDFGTVLLRLGRLDEAQHQLERALVLHRSAEILDLLAQVHDARRDVQRAEQYWLEAIALDPGYLPGLKVLARLALRQDQPEKSVEFLTNALEFAPNDLAIQTNLAVAYERAGRSDEAAVHANRANQLRQLQNLREQMAAQARGNPNAPESRLLAAIRDIEERRTVDAETRLREILRENPDFVPAQRLLEALNRLQ